MNYKDFIRAKEFTMTDAGFDASLGDYPLFDYQRDITRWALMRGKAAIFADTGLGKTIMQLAFADQVVKHTKKRERVRAEFAGSGGTTSNAQCQRLQRRGRGNGQAQGGRQIKGNGSTAECNPARSWAGWPAQSPVLVGDDGLPGKLDGITIPRWRMETIMAAGNAIVPQVAYQNFKAIEAADNG